LRQIFCRRHVVRHPQALRVHLAMVQPEDLLESEITKAIRVASQLKKKVPDLKYPWPYLVFV